MFLGIQLILEFPFSPLQPNQPYDRQVHKIELLQAQCLILIL